MTGVFHEENLSSPQPCRFVGQRGSRDGGQQRFRPAGSGEPEHAGDWQRYERAPQRWRPINWCLSRCGRPDGLKTARCDQPGSLQSERGRRHGGWERRWRQRLWSLKTTGVTLRPTAASNQNDRVGRIPPTDRVQHPEVRHAKAGSRFLLLHGPLKGRRPFAPR